MGSFLFRKILMVHNKFVSKNTGGFKMSPKELLYAEDALAHMKFMKQKCDYVANQLTDANLQQLTQRVAKKYQMMFDDIYNVVVTHANGGA